MTQQEQLTNMLSSFVCNQWLYETFLYKLPQMRGTRKELVELDDFTTSLWLESDSLDAPIKKALVDLSDISTNDIAKSFKIICAVLENLAVTYDPLSDEYPLQFVMIRQDVIEESIRRIIELIRNTEHLEEARLFFAVLDEISIFLSSKLHRKNIDLTGELIDFVREFDRIDDEELMKSLYLMIKQGSGGFFGGLLK